MKANTTSRTCFLSAPFGADTRTLERELEKRKFSVTDGRTVVPSAPLIEDIRRRIADADLVCVVSPSGMSANSAFEIGVAVGVAKQVIVFAPIGTALPSDLLGVMYCPAAVDDEVGIGRFLEAFLAHGRSRFSGNPSSHPVHRLSRSQSKSLRQQMATAAGMKFENLVKKGFEDAGYIASETAGPEERGVDFAVWVDRLQHAFGNPIAVEVKDRLSKAGVGHAEEALRFALQRTRSSLGLLIYRSVDRLPGHLTSKPSWPLVVRLEADELLVLLERGTFESTLIGIRNRAVHGVGDR